MPNILTNEQTDRRGFLSRFFSGTPEVVQQIEEHNARFNLNQPRFESLPFIGQIMICSFNFAPKGWPQCNGQFLPINQNQALYSLLGTTYGGNGTTTFALPDFRGRYPIHFGNGFTRGQAAGAATHTLTANQMPQHTHGFSPQTVQVLGTGTQVKGMAQVGSLSTSTQLTLTNAGSGLSHNNMPPYLVPIFCIALGGLFPVLQ